MSNFISFRPCDVMLRGYIRFAVTKSSFQQLIDLTGDPLRVLASLSASRTLIAFQDKPDGPLKICTTAGVFNCKQDSDGAGLTITTFKRTFLQEQNAAMKHGVCFQSERGILVKITLTSPFEQYLVFHGGNQFSTDQFEGVSGAPAMQEMFRAVANARLTQPQEEPEAPMEAAEEEEYIPDWHLEELLDTAEDYANLAAELEMQKANDTGNIPYHSVRGAHYERLDRIAYTFGVEDLDEEVFKEGTQVEVEDRDGNSHTAKILQLVKPNRDASATGMVLLFTGQISRDSFPSQGFFTLSRSNVNRDVQLAAIEKIRTGTARSTYMDAVLGRNQPGGFDRKDMTPVDRALAQREHPLNPAQQAAVYKGINARDILLVMGPPGTGKTTVIQEWVRYFVTQEHKRVLVSSQNHKAVDNVFTRLAEETDIEMIRIGVEDNLQAEVVPYTFEKKIKALRQRIDSGTGQHILNISLLLNQWLTYSQKVRCALEADARCHQAQQAFARQVQQQLAPLYRSLQAMLEDRDRLQQRMEKLAQTLHKLAGKLRYHEEATNPFVRFFTGLFYKLRLGRLRKLSCDLQDMRTQEKFIADAYREQYGAYASRLSHLKAGPYQGLEQARHQALRAFRELGEKPLRDETVDIWDLFAASRQMPAGDISQLSALEHQLQADIARGRTLRGCLEDWQKEMAGKQNYALGEIVLESVSLVGATCIGVSSQRRFADLKFDVTIIDEAGQIQIHNALVPMSVSEKVIMLGDHKQIPPQKDEKLEALCARQIPPVDPTLLQVSLFEHLYNTLPREYVHDLDTQYRIPEQIADIISRWFYGGNYHSFQNKVGLTGVLPRISDSPFVIIDTAGCPERFETPEDKSFYNELEATVAASLVQHIASQTQLPLSQVGVVSAQKPQAKRIRRKLASFLPQDVADAMAATLDSFQGQERDVIIFSFTRCSRIPAEKNRIGFLKELRRLNVAMTRAKKTLVLIGDMEFLRSCACLNDRFGNPIEANEKVFSDFIQTMLDAVAAGSGQRMTVAQYLEKLKGGES